MIYYMLAVCFIYSTICLQCRYRGHAVAERGRPGPPEEHANNNDTVDFRNFIVFLLGRDPGTLKSDIVSKKHPQSICSDLRLSN